MLRLPGLCLCLLLCVQHCFAISAVPAHKVFYAPAVGNTLQPYVELYWQIDPHTVQFAKNEKEFWISKIATHVKIYGKDEVFTDQKYYLQTTPAISALAATMQNIIDLHRASVKPGVVFIELTLTEDGNANQTYVFTDSFTVSPAPAKTFYSDIQLIDTAYTASQAESIFYKNGHLQIPLGADFLDDYRSTLHYYTELYNTTHIPATELPLIQESYISKKPDEYVVYKLLSTDTIVAAPVIPVLGRFRIDILPSGNYYLNTVIKTIHGKEINRNSLFFQRSNAYPVTAKDTTVTDTNKSVFEKVTVFDLTSTFVGKYNAPQLKAILKMLLPIANEVERGNIESFQRNPDETYMKYFVHNFWKEHAPADPEKGWNNYANKVKEVNRLYGSRIKPGYETERGFIYLKYGAPDQKYTVSNEEGALPYEVWYYNAPGKQSFPGAFLFVNQGFMGNDYRLLHTTVIGETRNMAWRDQLYPNGRKADALNSRAEQIFQNK